MAKFVVALLLLFHATSSESIPRLSELNATASTATTISIAWIVNEDITIDRFEVTYHYSIKQCSAPYDTYNKINITNGTVVTHTLENLNEDSVYTITVTAIYNDSSTTMGTITAETGTSSK